jgi:hypothetical protein
MKLQNRHRLLLRVSALVEAKLLRILADGETRHATVRLPRPGKSAWNDDQSSDRSACHVIVISLELTGPTTVRNPTTLCYRGAWAVAVSPQVPA